MTKDSDISIENGNVELSFIIPTYNEEDDIERTLRAITTNAPRCEYEIIVVDNGSSDDTVSIAKRCGAKVHLLPEGNISAVRNFGVSKSQGNLLVFIDADVSITPAWQNNIDLAIDRLKKNPLQITGSRYLPPTPTDFLSKYWYMRLTEYKSTYINSGHLITTPELYDKIDGFDPDLQTAEDYDFCQRASQVGATIDNSPDLEVIHFGYPQSILPFMLREKWHGGEDVQSLSKFKKSKIAQVAALNLIMAVAAVLHSIVFKEYLGLILYFLAMGLVCLALTIRKFGTSKLRLLAGTSLMFFFYLWGRSFSIANKLTFRH